jgi:endoglucanase
MSWRHSLPLALLLLGCDSAESQLCPAGQSKIRGTCQVPPVSVRVSSVGFVPGSSKHATYAGQASTFVVRRVSDDSIVFPDTPGSVGPGINATDSGEPEVHVIDFSDLDAPGEYYLDVTELGRSNPFSIRGDAFVEPFQASMIGMYGWRCGTAVSFEWHGQAFGHAECHLDDGPAALGWHDAGDYGKYTNNGAFSLGVMLLAWDHFRDRLEGVTLDVPEQDNGIPDYLDECAFQLRWLLGMQIEGGGVSDRITPTNFDGLAVMPEASFLPRNMAPPSTKATADFAAVAAHAARIFREFDPELAELAEEGAGRAWDYLLENPTPIPPPVSGFTGSYGAGMRPDPDTDDRLWAAAQMFELTGDEDALAAFETTAMSRSVDAYWDWDNLTNLGVFAYLDSERDGRSSEVVDRLLFLLKRTADSMVTTAAAHPYGRTLGNTYNWGINGTIARTTPTLLSAARFFPENERAYTDTATEQLAHLFGRNFYGRSFLTGVGDDPPKSPHHRPSVADGIEPPWPGLLVGGPSKSDLALLPATLWVDDAADYTSNEVAINWNAPLIYALAAFLPAP